MCTKHVTDSVSARSVVLALCIAFASQLPAADRGTRYAVILRDPPLAAAADTAAKEGRRLAEVDYRRRIEEEQAVLRTRLTQRKIRVLDSTQTLLNAVYVIAGPEDVGALSAMPGVARVVEMPPLKRNMIKAVDLVNAPAGWAAVGGEAQAGAGVRIAIIDSGIDHEHPAFQDPSLGTPPPSYPRCRLEGDCAFTNNKVLVARSYVDLLVLPEEPEFSRPDDLSPRDRVGHGTATAMVAAGARHNSPLGSISGVAPKAYLGNYKVFGSPGVNDVTFDNVIIRALEDALVDGMDIAVLSLGTPALWRPSDRGSTCDLGGSNPCDPRADAVENAVRRGLLVVVSAGNDGDLGRFAPAFNSIHSPGTAPSALTVGATTNSQIYNETFRLTGPDVPASLQQMDALLGSGPRPQEPLRAPVRNVASVSEDPRACRPIARGSLTGTIALIERGDCLASLKVKHAQQAGAVAAVIYRPDDSDFLFVLGGLGETGIPAMLIGSTAGRALREFVAANPDREGEIDPTLRPITQTPDLMAFFSSYGPSIQDGAIKPEVVAPGDQTYTATQRLDPNGDMYSANGYIAIRGTSFAAPVAAGAAALFKQRFRNATPAQAKSAVVNTSDPDVFFITDQGGEALESIVGMGAGKVDAAGPARTTVTVEPSTLSFGILTATLPSIGLLVNNHDGAPANLRLEVNPYGSVPSARVVLSESQFALGSGQSRQVSVRLEGSRPQPGLYEGEVVITGGAVPIRVPYLYLVADNVAANVFPLRGFNFVGEADARTRLAFKLVDRFGVPVSGVPVTFRPTVGGGAIDVVVTPTDNLGISEATVFIGPQLGDQEFVAEAGGFELFFTGRSRLAPAINTDGVVNAASGQIGRGLAPGSYISIFGRNLSEAFAATRTPWLPYGLAGVSVSFDAPGGRSYPGRIHFVSDGQINVQVPWELQGVNTVLLKVSIGDTSSALYTLPLNDYAPGAFEFAEPGSGRMLFAALDESFGLVTTANPVQRGRIVQLYANGLGPVNDRPPTGEPSPFQPLSTSRTPPEVTIGGRPARVLFSGLAPGFVGLYQVNAEVAADTPTGIQPVVLTVGGVSSKPASLPIN
jgi:uncharacterized protein (TIGR03437 family)